MFLVGQQLHWRPLLFRHGFSTTRYILISLISNLDVGIMLTPLDFAGADLVRLLS
jgi:hypothetical protein